MVSQSAAWEHFRRDPCRVDSTPSSGDPPKPWKAVLVVAHQLLPATTSFFGRGGHLKLYDQNYESRRLSLSQPVDDNMTTLKHERRMNRKSKKYEMIKKKNRDSLGLRKRQNSRPSAWCLKTDRISAKTWSRLMDCSAKSRSWLLRKLREQKEAEDSKRSPPTQQQQQQQQQKKKKNKTQQKVVTSWHPSPQLEGLAGFFFCTTKLTKQGLSGAHRKRHVNKDQEIDWQTTLFQE